MRKHLFAFLKIFVSVGLILVLLYLMRDKYAQVGQVLKGTNIPAFGLALVIYLFAIALASLRFKIIAKAQDIDTTFAEAFSLNFIGYFFNNFLPSAIGGDVVKAFYLSKKSSGKVEAYASTFLDRAVGLITMIFMAFFAIFFVGSSVIDRNIKHLIYGISLAAFAALFFMMNKAFARKFQGALRLVKPIREPLQKAYNILNRYTSHKSLVVQSLVISVASQSMFFLSLGMLAVSAGYTIPLIQIFLRMPIIGTISLLPSINGLGVRESATVVFFGPIIGDANAFAVSVLWLLMLMITSVLGGMIYAASPQFKVKIKEA